MEETADSHDLDKLIRWHEGLASASDGKFPVCALFLASGEDSWAHDIFRIYRTAFEEMGAGFHDLVIFGQHGMSSTCAALVPGLGLSGLQAPSLVLIIIGDNGSVYYITPLPAGKLPDAQPEVGGIDVPWQVALGVIKQAVGKASEFSLDGVAGLERVNSAVGTLADAVSEVKIQLQAA